MRPPIVLAAASLLPLLSLTRCAHGDAAIKPGDSAPPASSVSEDGQSEAWSAPTPELIAYAKSQSFADYRTQLDLARAGSPGAITRIQAFTPFAASAPEAVKASHVVSLRELRQIQPAAFDQALASQQSTAVANAVQFAVGDDSTER